MNKKRAVIVLVVLILLLAGALFIQRSPVPQDSQQTQLITPSPINPSVMPQPLSSGFITYSGDIEATFPTSVPYYEITRVRSFESERSRLFALYAPNAIPNVITGSKGRYASFSQNGRSGLISENPLSFAFQMASASGRFVSNDLNTYSSLVQSALTELSVLPAPYTTTLLSQQFLSFNDPHPTELTSPQGAVITRLNYTVALDGVPLYVNDANTPVFSASINGDGAITEILGFILPDVSRTEQNLAIIPYSEAVSRLRANRGVLSSISLTKQGDQEFMTGETPSTIKITGVSLGYFFSALQNYLIPVFVFEGSAEETEGSALLRTTTIVSAL